MARLGASQNFEMIKNRTTTYRRGEWRDDSADCEADPRWRSFVMASHRCDFEALDGHVAGWARRPRPGMPKARGPSATRSLN